MKWKIFFWVLCFFSLYELAAIVSVPFDELFPEMLHLVIFIGEIIGLFAYIYNKKIASPYFWKYFLWINIILDILSIVYTLYPDLIYIQFFRFFSGKTIADINMLMVGILIDLPLLYVMYQLSKEKFYIPESKKVIFVSPGIPKWSLIQTAFWGYSLVLSSVFLLSNVLPQSQAADVSAAASSDVLYGVLMTAPMVVFWLMTLFQLKFYQKKWWRLTLLANGVLISLMILVGILFPTELPISQPTIESEFIGMLQFLIMIISLYIYGREQFPKNIDKKIIA